MKKTRKEWATLIMGAWVIIGVIFASITFAYKAYEIINTIERGDVVGFALVQILTYLFVAVGFFFLFVASFIRGDFYDCEGIKHRVLEMEERMNEIEGKPLSKN